MLCYRIFWIQLNQRIKDPTQRREDAKERKVKKYFVGWALAQRCDKKRVNN